MSKPVDETGHTELETLLARALWQHGFLLASVYVTLGKKTIPSTPNWWNG